LKKSYTAIIVLQQMGLLTTRGRPSNKVEYRDVSYNGLDYVVGTFLAGEDIIEFVIDSVNSAEVKQYSWHRSANHYISTATTVAGGRKELYLHDFIMGPVAQGEAIDHINRNGFDNRKANLRIVPQTAQATNQAKKKRSVILPEGCGIDPDTIPKHIWYIHPNGLHGDRFAIEFKTEGIIWKSTSSKRICLEDKLKQAVARLNELYAAYPHLNPVLTDADALELERTYQEIIAV
jgi:hypothetical protein